MAYISERTGEEVDALLDKVEKSDFNVTIDTELSKESNNPIANSAVTKALAEKVDKEDGKGLSTNDFTTDEKNKVAEIDSIKEATEQNTEALEGKANIDGYYTDMSVGFADNLVGRGDATEEEFTYRPTAGDTSIESGVARIAKIKGNSVVLNQLVDGGHPKLDLEGISTSYDEETKEFILENISKSSNYTNGSTRNGFSPQISTIPNHKYIAFINKDYKGIAVIALTSYVTFPTNTIFSIPTSETLALRITKDFDFATQCPIGAQIRFKLAIVDLTKEFGAGNEPTTIEEFYARMPMGIDPYAYNAGEIIDMNVDAIKTVGFNQFNGTYARVIGGQTYYLRGDYTSIGFTTEVGGRTTNIPIPSDLLYTPIQNGYIYAEGTDICINLSHSGYKNGTYEPYETFTRELPVIAKYFPEGMRSAGSVCDSIEWDSSKQKWVAIQRVESVDLGSSDIKYDSTIAAFYLRLYNSKTLGKAICPRFTLNNVSAYQLLDGEMSLHNTYYENTVIFKATSYSNASSFKAAMAGIILNYELAKPIITEIDEDDLNFDYEAEDFGTEEAIASVPSAPFRADVIYQLNAVDRIRNNSGKIAELEAKIASLMQTMSAMMTSNSEEYEG